jgi:hypothetical protein
LRSLRKRAASITGKHGFFSFKRELSVEDREEIGDLELPLKPDLRGGGRENSEEEQERGMVVPAPLTKPPYLHGLKYLSGLGFHFGLTLDELTGEQQQAFAAFKEVFEEELLRLEGKMGGVCELGPNGKSVGAAFRAEVGIQTRMRALSHIGMHARTRTRTYAGT